MANIIGTQTVNGIWIVNTDTNPTLTGGVDAPIGSWGLAADGSGFFYKFGASNTDWEQGASTGSMAGYNVLLVRKNPSTGQYATIEDAINAITAPASNNRWLILVGVGQFTENTLVLPNYTSVIGASIQETQIFPATPTQHIWELGVSNELSFMWLEGAGPGYSAIHVNDSGNYSQAHKVTFNDNDINVLIESTTQDTFFYGEYLDFNGTYSYGLKVIATGGFRAFANIENYYNYPTGGLAISNHITGPNSDAHLLAGGCEGVNTGTAFYIQDGASLQLTSFNINNFDKGIHNGNVGAACTVLVSGVVVKDIATYDIQIEHLTTSGTIGGVFDDTKISLASSLVSLLVQDTNDGSLLITNKLNVLFSDGTITDVSSLIIEGATMGVERGGTLSDGGGFDVNVLAGNGYFELFPDVDIIKRLDWNNTSITLSANVNLFIYFNNNGVLVSNGAQPDTRYNILLGRVVTNGTGIEFIDASPLIAEHTSNLILNNLREAIGSIYASGSIVTENATPLNLDITSGEYYYGENEFSPSGGTGITFTAFYGQGSGVITSQTAVNNTQYDNAGTLTALTAGYYTKASLYLVGQGVNERYYYVFAEAQYSTLLAVQQADIPLPPNTFTGSVVLIAGIIIQEGNPNIVQIVDQRPIIGYRAFGVTASADHLSLLNLNGGVNGDGGHTNMFTVNGSKPMTGNLNMGTNNIINIGTANGVTIEAHASRHLPNGLDPLTTAAPTTNLGGASTNSVGIQNSFSRSDHSHAIDIASTSVTGLLTSTDWNTFNNKLSTADNGLTATLGNVQWGGSLIQDTYIDGAFGIWHGFTTPLVEYYIVTGGPNQFGNVSVTGGAIAIVGQDNAVGLARLDITATGAFGPSAEMRVQNLLNTVYSSIALPTAGLIQITSTSALEIQSPSITINGIATVNKILYTGVGGVLAGVTIGSGLSFAGGTLSATGGTGTVTSVTLALGTTGLTGGSTITTSGTWTLAGTLVAANGGTGQSTYTTGDILYSSAANTLSKLPIGTAGQQLTVVAGVPTWSSGGTGTVTSVSVVTANGISGSVATATTTPAITLTLGAITPTTVNGNTFTTGTGTLTLSTFTLTVAATSSISGTNTGDQTITLTGDVTGSGTGSFATTIGAGKVTNAMLVNSSVTINGTSISLGASGTVTAAAGTLTGTTLNATVVSSSLTSVGTLTGGATGAGFTIALSTSTVTGTLAATNGGTGQSTYATGDILYASAANTLSKLAIGTVGQVLKVVAGIPSWQTDTTTGTVTSVSVVTNQGVSGSVANPTTTPAITLTLGALTGITSFNGLVITANTGIITTGTWSATAITETRGGTNQTTYATGDTLYASAVNTLSKLPIGTAGQTFTIAAGIPKWVTEASLQSTPADPATTTSTVGVMMGLAGSITPTKSGTIMIVVTGDTDNTTINRGTIVQIRTGTGTAPINGAALTGTTRGSAINSLGAGTTNRFPFSCSATITGLTVGTAIWIDLSLAVNGGSGTARVRNISISVIEI